jgi:hypothetical protein
MNVLCWLGIHSWEHMGMLGLSLDSSLKRCRRCEIGHMDICYGQAYCRYTPVQVEGLLRLVAERKQQEEK